jgi:hypothetical protein
MRTRARTWLAAATLLLLVGRAQPAGSMAVVAFADDAGAEAAGRGLAAPAAAGLGPAPGPLALARPVGFFLTDRRDDVATEPLARAAAGRRTPTSRALPARPEALGGERARILLRSLTLPGWGQATLGRRTSTVFFGLTEAAIWGTFTAFRIQSAIRQDNYMRLATIFAGIDLAGRNEEWRRIVGGFSSSEEYNRLVVARDAANIYLQYPESHYQDPEDYYKALKAYRAYIEEHSLRGADAWNWASPEAQERYRGERRYAQRAAQRANTALAVAVANRIVSALHAARVAGRPEAGSRSWWFEVVPAAGPDPTALLFRVRTQF